jgi:acyl dehydratase
MVRRSYRIHDRDFVVNSIWEGAGDELHSNDLYAARTEFGARIVSGIALVSLCVAPRMGELGWPAPRRAALSFDRAVKSGDQIDIDLKEHPSGEAMEVAVGGRRALRVDFGHPADVVLKRSADFRRTKGRTFTAGDREAFDWWITASLPDVTLAPEDIVPWPLLASAVSGFIGRIDIVKSPHSSLVNRFNEWSFFRSVRIGETVHAEVHDPRERDSVSKPGWGIWTARVLVVSDSDGDVVACSKWVCMYMHANQQ